MNIPGFRPRPVHELFPARPPACLLLIAASLATTLHYFRRRRLRAREAEGARGRTVIAEIPAADDLVLFSEDSDAFFYGDLAIPKETIAAARQIASA